MFSLLRTSFPLSCAFRTRPYTLRIVQQYARMSSFSFEGDTSYEEAPRRKKDKLVARVDEEEPEKAPKGYVYLDSIDIQRSGKNNYDGVSGKSLFHAFLDGDHDTAYRICLSYFLRNIDVTWEEHFPKKMDAEAFYEYSRISGKRSKLLLSELAEVLLSRATTVKGANNIYQSRLRLSRTFTMHKTMITMYSQHAEYFDAMKVIFMYAFSDKKIENVQELLVLVAETYLGNNRFPKLLELCKKMEDVDQKRYSSIISHIYSKLDALQCLKLLDQQNSFDFQQYKRIVLTAAGDPSFSPLMFKKLVGITAQGIAQGIDVPPLYLSKLFLIAARVGGGQQLSLFTPTLSYRNEIFRIACERSDIEKLVKETSAPLKEEEQDYFYRKYMKQAKKILHTGK